MHLPASNLTEMPIFNYDGHELGRIEDLMLDTSTGTVDYVVLSFGGIMGFGDKLFAVPMRALKVDAGSARMLLDVDRETLKSAPGFDRHHWPNTSDPEWHALIDSFYSY